MGADPSVYMTLGDVDASFNIASSLYTAASISFNILSGNYVGAGKGDHRGGCLQQAQLLRPVARLGDEAARLFGRIWSQTTVKSKLAYPASSTVLRHNMVELLGNKVPVGHQAHHIVGGAYQEGLQARAILTRQGIDVNSMMNGVFLPGCGKPGIGSIHCGKHARAYEQVVLERLRPLAHDKTALINELNRVREDLLTGAFRLNKH